MSYLADELERQMEIAAMSGPQLAERTKKISASQIYNWLNSVQTSIGQEQMESLASALSQDPVMNAHLVKAHLLDERFGPGSELVRVEIDGNELKDRQRPRTKREKSLQFLAELSLTSRDCNSLLIDLARCLGAEL